MPSLIGKSGLVQLGSRIASGGEGTVYDVVGRPEIVAKVYHGVVSRARQEKLEIMESSTTPALAALTAWPSEVLRRPGGEVCGFLMPKIKNGKDIHKLYGPRSRLSEFPSADWRLLVRAALNTARAFSVLHEAGYLVADVNHGGITVASDATVKLIDCDSFQVSRSGKTYLCEVGVDILRRLSFRGGLFLPQ